MDLSVAVRFKLAMNEIPYVFVSFLTCVLIGRVCGKCVRSCHYTVQLCFHALVYKLWNKCRPISVFLCVVISTNVILEINKEHIKRRLCLAQANLKLQSLFGV